MGWFEFITAFVVFFLSHSIPVRPAMRAKLVATLGPRGFTIGYSILSLGVLIWLIGAASRAPYVALWDWAVWQNLIVLAVMAFVIALLALSIGRPNPFSFGGARNDMFDPEMAGIVAVFRHPLLVALALWAMAHMIANGDLAHVVLFGTFAGFALVGQRIIDRRKQRQMGAQWGELKAKMRIGTLNPKGTVLRQIIAVLAFGVLLWLHPMLFGVNPLP
ncbi:MAG: putative membrane protein [Paracoccaceae bacterium]